MVRTLRSLYRLCDANFVIVCYGGIARCSDVAWLGAGLEGYNPAKDRTRGDEPCVDETSKIEAELSAALTCVH